MPKGRPLFICLIWAGVLPIFPVFVPYLGNIFALFTPVPFLILNYLPSAKQGILYTAIGLLPCISLGILKGHLQLLFLGLQLASLGLLLGMFLKKGLHPYRAIFLAVAILTAIEAGLLLGLAAEKGLSLSDMVSHYLKLQLEQLRKGALESGAGLRDAEQLEIIVSRFISLFAKIYPAMIMVVTSMLSLVCIAIAHPLLGRLNLRPFDIHGIKTWVARRELVWAFILSGFGILFIEGNLKWGLLNIFIVVTCIYFFQGISVLIYLMDRYRVPSWLRILIFFLLGLQQVFLFIVAGLGLLDTWVVLRRGLMGYREAH